MARALFLLVWKALLTILIYCSCSSSASSGSDDNSILKCYQGVKSCAVILESCTLRKLMPQYDPDFDVVECPNGHCFKRGFMPVPTMYKNYSNEYPIWGFWAEWEFGCSDTCTSREQAYNKSAEEVFNRLHVYPNSPADHNLWSKTELCCDDKDLCNSATGNRPGLVTAASFVALANLVLLWGWGAYP